MPKLLKPGEKSKVTGKYVETGPKGGKLSGARYIFIVTGDRPLPPTQKKGRRWKRVTPLRSIEQPADTAAARKAGAAASGPRRPNPLPEKGPKPPKGKKGRSRGSEANTKKRRR